MNFRLKNLIEKIKSKLSLGRKELEEEYDDDSTDETLPELPSQDFEVKDDFPAKTTPNLGQKLKSLFTRKTHAEGTPENGDNKGFLKKTLAATVFALSNRGPLHRVFILLLLLIFFYTLGKVLALFLTPAPELKTLSTPAASSVADSSATLRLFAQIRNANLFDAKTEKIETPRPQVPFKPIIDEGLICTNSSTKSQLPIKLLSTIVLQEKRKSIASLNVRNGADLENFREGDKVRNLAQIGQINRLKVIIKNLKTGRCEYLENQGKNLEPNYSILTPEAGQELIKSKKSGIINEGNKFTIPRSVLDDKLKDISSLLTQAMAIPVRNPDGTMCFKMVEVDPGSIFAVLGIRVNDNICGINGSKINSLNQVMGLFGKLGTLSNISLSLKRGGAVTEQQYNITK